MSNQEVADSRLLRNSLTSLSPFPFKACSERIIDFYFLALTTFSEETFWPQMGAASMLDRVLGGGDWELVKQRNTDFKTNKQITKQTTRQIEFSDAFNTKNR